MFPQGTPEDLDITCSRVSFSPLVSFAKFLFSLLVSFAYSVFADWEAWSILNYG